MDKNNFETFSQYRERVKNNNSNNNIASIEEVMEDLKDVMVAFGKEVK